ncbi:MAG: hypothetical protein CL878_04545 [Dehalococcoidia bacterium]|nr:hypothetical protein [Dehalococcoidia bacterium]
MATTPRPTRVERWDVVCADHGHEGPTYALAGGTTTYGRLLGKTPRNEFAEFEALDHDVYEEVKQLVLQRRGGASGHSRCLTQVLGVACDRAPSGYRYDFTSQRWCPVCGTSNLRECGPVIRGEGAASRIQIDVVDIPLVTHREWAQLSQAEKRKRLRQALREADCLP